MHIEDGVAPIELLPDGLMCSIAGPFPLIVVGIDADAVGLQSVVSVCDLFQRTFDVRERNRGEHSEPFGIIGHALRAVIVDQTARGASLLGVVVNDVCGLSERQDRNSDSELVHLLDGPLGCPGSASATGLGCRVCCTAPASATSTLSRASAGASSTTATSRICGS